MNTAALTPGRVAACTLIALTAVAVTLRAIGIDGGLWLDEILTLVESVRHSLRAIATTFPGNNQHTLYSLLAHVSVQTFGEAPWSLRLPALIFGAATPAMLYLFAREFTGRVEALLAALVIAVSYHHVWFSQNARGYSTLAFFALLSSWLLLRALRRGRVADFVAYAIACALGAYTHLTMIALVLGQAAACVLHLGWPRNHAALVRWRLPLVGFALAAALTLALYAPLLLAVQRFFLNRTMPAEVATPAWAVKALLAGLRLGLGTALGALAGATLLIVGLWSYFRQNRFLAALFVLPGLFTVATVLALRQPIFPRFLFFLSGFGVLVVVRGAMEIGAWLSRRRMADGAAAPVTAAGTLLVVAMAAAAGASLPFDYRYPKQDFEGAMRFVDARRGAGEAIVAAGGAIYPFREYYKRNWPAVRSTSELKEIRGRGERVWMIYTLAEYIEADAPDLMRTLREDCSLEQVFRGTVAGGDVTVCTLAPATMNAARTR